MSASGRRVLVAPDSFGGSLSASEVADAVAAGWRSVAPADEVETLPLSDGGPGFVDALYRGVGGDLVAVETTDPLGRPVAAQVLVAGDTGYVESAQACGLHLLAATERNPLRASTSGVAALLIAALRPGVRRVVVGLGGSATNDGGAGLLQALADEPHDRWASRPHEVDLVAATDVDNPLLGPTGATAVFGPQKGADAAQLALLEERLARHADALAPELADLPGAGAAGGLGFALFALGARRASGADLVLDALEVAARIAASDLVVTGEGCLDAQSLHGKLPVRVAACCLQLGKPCLAIAGRVRLTPDEWHAAGFAQAYSVEALAGSHEAALALGAAGVRQLAGDVAGARPPNVRP